MREKQDLFFFFSSFFCNLCCFFGLEVFLYLFVFFFFYFFIFLGENEVFVFFGILKMNFFLFGWLLGILFFGILKNDFQNSEKEKLFFRIPIFIFEILKKKDYFSEF